jgi:epoxyqueuosine reductase QueG
MEGRLKADIKLFSQKLGADLIGIASTDRFIDAPVGFRPHDIMPAAKSVVVVAKRMPQELIANVNRLTFYTAAVQTAFTGLDHIAYMLTCFLEEQGGKALPVPADNPYTSWDEEAKSGRGELSHRHAAVAAGLGRLGKNSLLITPQYGNRVHLVSIITDQVIEPDPIVNTELCPPTCQRCIDACPARALQGNGMVDQKRCRENSGKVLPRGFSVYA